MSLRVFADESPNRFLFAPQGGMEEPPFQFGLKTLFGLATLVVLLLSGWLDWIISATLLVVVVAAFGVLVCHIMIWVCHGLDVVIGGTRPPDACP